MSGQQPQQQQPNSNKKVTGSGGSSNNPTATASMMANLNNQQQQQQMMAGQLFNNPLIYNMYMQQYGNMAHAYNPTATTGGAPFLNFMDGSSPYGTYPQQPLLGTPNPNTPPSMSVSTPIKPSTPATPSGQPQPMFYGVLGGTPNTPHTPGTPMQAMSYMGMMGPQTHLTTPGTPMSGTAGMSTPASISSTQAAAAAARKRARPPVTPKSQAESADDDDGRKNKRLHFTPNTPATPMTPGQQATPFRAGGAMGEPISSTKNTPGTSQMQTPQSSSSARGKQKQQQQQQQASDSDDADDDDSDSDAETSGTAGEQSSSAPKTKSSAKKTKERKPQKKRGLFTRDIAMMMHAFGDVKNPLQESVDLMEELALDYIHEMTTRAVQVGSRRGKLGIEDFIFLIRKDQKKFARAKELLKLNEDIERARRSYSAKGAEY